MTKSTFFVEEDKIISTLFENGLERLHLYKPGSSPIFSERLLSLLKEDYHKRIIVHEHFYLKDEFKLGGIHLDQADEAEAPKGYKGKVSRACNDLAKLKDLKKRADYVFLRNIFDSIEYRDRGEVSTFTMQQTWKMQPAKDSSTSMCMPWAV